MSVELRLPRVLEKGFPGTVIGSGVVGMTASGSAGIFGGRAKVGGGCVMLVRSRQIAYRYVMIVIGRSEDHYGLFTFVLPERANAMYN